MTAWLGSIGVLAWQWGPAVAGWGVATGAAVVLLRLRSRFEAVARAEHELRGPVTVLLLACERMRREPMGRRYARVLELELERMAAGLAALTQVQAGRTRGRSMRTSIESRDMKSFASTALAGWAPTLRARGRRSGFEWDAGKIGLPRDRAAFATALGNLVANAAEHGNGSVKLRGSRTPGGVRVEVRNETSPQASGRGRRGRGLTIAAAAAKRAGGGMTVARTERDFCAALELPLDATTTFDDWPQRPNAASSGPRRPSGRPASSERSGER
jgi:signal transduction histidine kinase